MTPPDDTDLAASAVRALVLYSLAQGQAGHAATIRVFKRRADFGVADDGRGHPLDKTLEGTPYLRFIYTHFDYPFEAARSAPVQLQGLGMSMVNALCAELVLTVRKPSETLTATYRHGRLVGSERRPVESAHTGITVRARLREGLPAGEGDEAENGPLQTWLQDIANLHPALQLLFNDRPLPPAQVPLP